MPKSETEAMAIAFDALKGQEPAIENRMLLWLKNRLQEHRRGQEALAYKGPEPTDWRVTSPNPDESGHGYTARADAIDEWIESPWEVIEITGHAAVCQEFMVAVPINDGDGIAYEHETFPTREEAENYATKMQITHGEP